MSSGDQDLPSPSRPSRASSDGLASSSSDTVESRLASSFKQYNATMQGLWKVLDFLKNGQATSTGPAPNGAAVDDNEPADDGAVASSGKKSQHLAKVNEARQLLAEAREAVEETHSALGTLELELDRIDEDAQRDDSAGAMRRSSSDDTTLDHAVQNEIYTLPVLDAKIEDAVKNVQGTVSRCLGELVSEISTAWSSRRDLDDGQKERVVMALERVTNIAGPLLCDAVKDVRHAVGTRQGRLEPVKLERRISLPTVGRYDEQSVSEAPAQQTAMSPFDGQHIRKGSGAQWDTSVESSPTRLDTLPGISGPMTSIPQGSAPMAAAPPLRPRIRGGTITSADLPSVFTSSDSESSHAGSARAFIRPVPVADTESWFQNAETERAQRRLRLPGPPPGPEPVVESAVEVPVEGAPSPSPSSGSTTGLSSGQSGSSSGQSEQGETDKGSVATGRPRASSRL